MSNEKYLKVMADYGTIGLWDHFGMPLTEGEVKALNLPFWLNNQIKELAALYDTNPAWEDGDFGNFDYVSFDKFSCAVAHKIKYYLPDYEILHFSEETCLTVVID